MMTIKQNMDGGLNKNSNNGSAIANLYHTQKVKS